MDSITSRHHILIVDDNPANIDVLYEHLSFADYEVYVAEDGLDAIKLAQQSLPDLILLDVMMPGINGFETHRRLLKIKETASIPVIYLTALADADVKIQGFALGGVDFITKPFNNQEVLARVKAHLEIRDLQKQLQQRNDMLLAFAHMVAHDLRGPLQQILNFTEMVQEREQVSPRSQKYLQLVVDTSFKMHHIIDGLLLLAKIDRVEVIIEPMLMEPVVQETLNRSTSLLLELDQPIIDMPDEWPVALGYPPWIEEVWANYLSNAVKYGGRPLHIQFGATPQDDGMIRFWLQDNGAGLSPEQQAHLFAEFSYLDNGHSLKQGAGLGLSIVKRIIDRLGGEVGIVSEGGQGSTFYFTLPGISYDLSDSDEDGDIL